MTARKGIFWKQTLQGALAAACLTTGADAPAQKSFLVNPLPEVRNMHGSCVAGDWLVVVGGTVSAQLTSSSAVLVSRIDPDRQIGEWKIATSLPDNRVYISNSVVSQANRLYVVGGQIVTMQEDKTELKTYSRTAYYSEIDETGKIAPWKTSGEMPGVGGVGCAAAVTDKMLYAISGQPGDDTVTKAFCYAALDAASGAPGDFKAGPELPSPLWFHAAIVSGVRLYVAGGRPDTTLNTSAKVFFSDLAADGTPGPWQQSPASMAFPVNNFGFQAVNGFLIAAGGRSNDNVLSDQLQYARVTPAGTAEWTTTGGAISPLYYAASAYAPKVSAIYLTGGRRTVYVAAMTMDVTCIPLRSGKATEATALEAPARPAVIEYQRALAQAKATGKPLLLICYSSQVPRSVDFCKSVAVAVTPADAEMAVLGYLDLAKNLDMATSLEIFRPPVYVLMGPDGALKAKSDTFPDLAPSMFLKQQLKGS